MITRTLAQLEYNADARNRGVEVHYLVAERKPCGAIAKSRGRAAYVGGGPYAIVTHK